MGCGWAADADGRCGWTRDTGMSNGPIFVLGETMTTPATGALVAAKCEQRHDHRSSRSYIALARARTSPALWRCSRKPKYYGITFSSTPFRFVFYDINKNFNIFRRRNGGWCWWWWRWRNLAERERNTTAGERSFRRSTWLPLTNEAPTIQYGNGIYARCYFHLAHTPPRHRFTIFDDSRASRGWRRLIYTMKTAVFRMILFFLLPLFLLLLLPFLSSFSAARLAFAFGSFYRIFSRDVKR